MTNRDSEDSRPRRLGEYALIVALIVLVALGSLALFGTQISDILAWIAREIHTQ